MANITPEKLAALLEKARNAAKLAAEQEAITKLQEFLSQEKPTEIDFTGTGVSNEQINNQDETAIEAAVEILQTVSSNNNSMPAVDRDNLSLSSDKREETAKDERNTSSSSEQALPKIGVARKITLNAKQQEACDLVLTGASCILIGAAGTGKTTGTNNITRQVIDSGRISKLSGGTKWLKEGSPGIVVVSYTNKAVNNIRHAVVEEVKQNTLTIHKLLEFMPVFYEIEDPQNPGQIKKTMRFEPTRNATNPLPPSLGLVIHEESSMESVELYQLLQDALPHSHQELFIGDIQQLPPVFGLAILGFKMLELPVVELTEVYRQALDSPIISLAWEILRGNYESFAGIKERQPNGRITVPALDNWSVSNEYGTVKFQPWQRKLSEDLALVTAVKAFTSWSDNGYYNPAEDIILCPYNVSFGTVEINKGIAQHLGVKREAIVHEVIAGYNKHYLAVGDRVLYNKEDAFIVSISKNADYLGAYPSTASKSLDRWGHYRSALDEQEVTQHNLDSAIDDEALDRFMEKAAASIDERVQAASHGVVIRLAASVDEEEILLDSATEINNLLGGYCITVHKSQGSEWEKVFLCFHNFHAKMISRELLYTAVTRARKFLHILCEPETFYNGIKSQRIKGNTLAEKAEMFKGKQDVRDKLALQQAEKKEVEFKPAAYKGAEKPIEISIPKTSTAPVALIKFHELVPTRIRKACEDAVLMYWNKAKTIWGQELGEPPTINFNLQKAKVIGVANFKRNEIKYNPIWSILAAEDAVIYNEMVHITTVHELCHLIEAKYAKGFGHGPGWIMAMKLMGVESKYVWTNDNDLPDWTKSYQQVMAKKLAELDGKVAGWVEGEGSEDGDVA